MRQTNKSLLSLPLATKPLMNNPGEHSNETTKEIDKLDDVRVCLISDTSASPSIKSRQWLSCTRIMPYGLLCTLVVLMMFAPDTPSRPSSRPSLRTSALQPSHIMATMPSTEVNYQIDLLFPPEDVPQATSAPEPNNKGQTLKIGVYRRIENIARWKHWATQHHFSLVTAKLGHGQDVYYVLYLCGLAPADVAMVATQIANISGESPLRVNESPCRLNKKN
ncbi:hypothetical protein ACK34T_08955 [Aeromonas veronii]